MRLFFVLFLFIANPCFSQNWQAEVMVGTAAYSGDLTKNIIDFKTLGPAININLKYPLYTNLLLLRGGIAFGMVSGNDQNNKLTTYKLRNLNFKSNILEGNLCLEFNLLDPEDYLGLPYVFGGVGVFHFNPYTKDANNVKTYLQPLGTEGQGLSAYPNKKMYSLTQLCLPFGGGWKQRINDVVEIDYELGARLLFTDYLDDVSTTYADPQQLLIGRGAKAVELAYRGPTPPGAQEGIKRGNPKSKDWYFFTGLKLVYKFGL